MMRVLKHIMLDVAVSAVRNTQCSHKIHIVETAQSMHEIGILWASRMEMGSTRRDLGKRGAGRRSSQARLDIFLQAMPAWLWLIHALSLCETYFRGRSLSVPEWEKVKLYRVHV